MKLRRWIVRILATLAVALPLSAVALYVANPFGARSADPRERILGHGLYRVPGDSMAPEIPAGSVVIVRAGHYTRERPQRGELVTAIAPDMKGYAMKRVIGLPGDVIGMEQGRLHVNGAVLDEPYVLRENATTDYSLELSPVSVPDGHYYLLGDNRDNSADSRMWGPLPREKLAGKLVAW